MKQLFSPLTELIGSLYDFLYDAAQKVLSLAKPVVVVGLLIDVITGKLGWIDHILEVYHRTLGYTSSASMLVVLFLGLVAVAMFMPKK